MVCAVPSKSPLFFFEDLSQFEAFIYIFGFVRADTQTTNLGIDPRLSQKGLHESHSLTHKSSRQQMG